MHRRVVRASGHRRDRAAAACICCINCLPLAEASSLRRRKALSAALSRRGTGSRSMRHSLSSSRASATSATSATSRAHQRASPPDRGVVRQASPTACGPNVVMPLQRVILGHDLAAAGEAQSGEGWAEGRGGGDDGEGGGHYFSSVHLDPVPVCYLCDPPNEHTPLSLSEGGRDDRGVPYHTESILSALLKCSRHLRPKVPHPVLHS